MKRGNRNTANKERDVNALEGVRSPPSKVKTPNEMTVTKTGMLFRINPLHCKIETHQSCNKIKRNASKSK